MTREYSETYFLSAGEVNAEGEMSLPLLTAKIIDIATAHANSLGIGNPDMASLGLGWVLSRLTIELTALPRANETYTLTTWIEDWNRHFSLRCFCLTDAVGNTLGYARSIWMVMNTSSRENAGLAHLSLPEAMISDRACPIARQAKHLPIFPEHSGTDLPAKSLRATAPTRYHTFTYCDLDFYRHVNTVRYVALLLNQFTLAEHDKARVSRIELNFLHEAQYGTEVSILKSQSDSEPMLYNLALKPAADGKETILFARIFFTMRLRIDNNRI